MLSPWETCPATHISSILRLGFVRGFFQIEWGRSYLVPFSRDGDLLFCSHSWQSYRVPVNTSPRREAGDTPAPPAHQGAERPPPRIQETPAFKYTPTPSPSSPQLPPPDVVLPSPSGHRSRTPGLAAAERHVGMSAPAQTEVSGQASPALKLSYAAQASASIVLPSRLLC